MDPEANDHEISPSSTELQGLHHLGSSSAASLSYIHASLRDRQQQPRVVTDMDSFNTGAGHRVMFAAHPVVQDFVQQPRAESPYSDLNSGHLPSTVGDVPPFSDDQLEAYASRSNPDLAPQQAWQNPGAGQQGSSAVNHPITDPVLPGYSAEDEQQHRRPY